MADAQSISLALIPKFTSALSILGSGYVIQHVLRDSKRVKETYHRLLLGMAVSDSFVSFWELLSTWPIPADSEGVFWAVGNTATCTASGFFIQSFALCTAIYSLSLSIYYVLVIAKQWSKEKIHKVEPFLHGAPITIGVGIGLAGIPLELYNNAQYVCWIISLPTDCGDGPNQPACIRGANAWIFQWAFMYAEVWTVFILITVSMTMIYRYVRKNEISSSRYVYKSSSSSRSPSSKSRLVAIQAIQYIVAFYFTWSFATVARVVGAITGKTPFVLLVLKTSTFPLQGLLNAVIYTRPQNWKKQQSTGSTNDSSGCIHMLFQKLSNGVAFSFDCCWCWCCSNRGEDKEIEEVKAFSPHGDLIGDDPNNGSSAMETVDVSSTQGFSHPQLIKEDSLNSVEQAQHHPRRRLSSIAELVSVVEM